MKVRIKLKRANLCRGDITVAAQDIEIELELSIKKYLRVIYLGAVGLLQNKKQKLIGGK